CQEVRLDRVQVWFALKRERVSVDALDRPERGKALRTVAAGDLDGGCQLEVIQRLRALDWQECADDDVVAAGRWERDRLCDPPARGDVAVVVLDVAVVAADDDQIDARVWLAALAVVGQWLARRLRDRERQQR